MGWASQRCSYCWATCCPCERPHALNARLRAPADSVAAFLQENLLNFVDEAAVEDVADCLEQLSAADVMAAGRRWGSEWRRRAAAVGAAALWLGPAGLAFWRTHPRSCLPLPTLVYPAGDEGGVMVDDDSPSATLLDAAAASTAARGVCFWNSHPAPRRWLPLKAPSLFTVARGAAANRGELARSTSAAWATHGGMGCA